MILTSDLAYPYTKHHFLKAATRRVNKNMLDEIIIKIIQDLCLFLFKPSITLSCKMYVCVRKYHAGQLIRHQTFKLSTALTYILRKNLPA